MELSLHRLNIELALQKFIWAPVYCCTHWLTETPQFPRWPGRYWSAKATSLCGPQYLYIVERLLLKEANPMSRVFQNIDPPLRTASVSSPGVPPPLLRVEDTLAGWRGGWGSIFWKTRDIGLASYSNNLSTLYIVSKCLVQFMAWHCHVTPTCEWCWRTWRGPTCRWCRRRRGGCWCTGRARRSSDPRPQRTQKSATSPFYVKTLVVSLFAARLFWQ